MIEMEDELPDSEEYESCRATVKFRVLFFTAIIAVAQAVYAILSYLESQDDINDGYLALPIAFMLLGVQAIGLIPCYTVSDSTKAKHIMLNLLENYTAHVRHISKGITDLAKQEMFMEELEQIDGDNAKAVQKLKAFDKAFEIAYKMIMTIVESLESEDDNARETKNFFTITPQPSIEDGKLRLFRDVVKKKPIGDKKGLMMFQGWDKIGISNMSQEDKDAEIEEIKKYIKELEEENMQNKTAIDKWETAKVSARQEFKSLDSERADLITKAKMENLKNLIDQYVADQKAKQKVYDQVDRMIQEQKEPKKRVEAYLQKTEPIITS